MDKKIRVIVADDSALMRKKISEILNSDISIEVVATVKNGREAIDAIGVLKPDVVTLDVEMPVLNGLDTLGYIMSETPTPCVMVSAFTKAGASETIRSLELGAIDFVTKPGGVISMNIDAVGKDIIEKIKLASNVPVSKLKLIWAEKRKPEHAASFAGSMSRVFAIASSTGGTQALASILPKLKSDIPAGILCVQHMPEGFTKSLSERLGWQSKISVIEAADMLAVKAGQAIIAKGGYHMEVTGTASSPVISLNTKPLLHGVRPSADLMMESAARIFGDRVIGIVLTGMGSDGTAGARAIKNAGGIVISEDQLSCVVYGMPKSVAEAGLSDEVVKLGDIPAVMERLLG